MVSKQRILRRAGLSYVSDDSGGYLRRRAGRSFEYLNSRGARITSAAALRRIEKLVIPPAWKDVWICPKPDGHIQATGRDERGRKQYIYHPRWQEEANKTKFRRIVEFGLVLPKVRSKYHAHLKLEGPVREKMLSTVTALLEKTHIRIGNEPYAEENYSYGLTTLKKKHIDVEKCTVHFKFPGKSRKLWELRLDHPKLCRAIRKCQELPGQQLFKYRNGDGKFHGVTSQDVNQYIKEISGEDFTAKDFRTWHATVSTFQKLKGSFEETKTARKKTVSGIIKAVARELNNTPAVCRKYYIHPAVFDAFEKGLLEKDIVLPGEIKEMDGLNREEKETLAFFRMNPSLPAGLPRAA